MIDVLSIAKLSGKQRRITFADRDAGGAEATIDVDADDATDAAFSSATDAVQAWADAARKRAFAALPDDAKDEAIKASLDDQIAAKQAELDDLTARVADAQADQENTK